MDLNKIKTSELINALMIRQETRSMDIKEGEGYKVQAANNDGSVERYLRGRGKVKILEIKL